MYRLFALAIAALLVIWPQAGDAQTIESVLRGLQERQKVLNFRDDPAGAFLLPIQWPEELGLEPFPEDGDIDNIEHMLSALQYAVEEYTRLAPLFLNYNTTELTKTKQRLMNQGRTAESLESTVDHVDEEWMAMYYELIEETVNEDPPVHVDVLQSAAFLPVNIGAISIHNWRDKLRYLASCVNELKVLPWEAQVTGAYGRAYNPSFEPDGNGWYVSQDHSDMSITFPGEGYTWAFAHTASSFNGSTPTAFEWRLEGGGSDEYATAWAHFSGIIGLRVNAGPLGGRVFILKAPVIQKWGDLGEAVANLQPTRLKVGSFIDINSVGGGQVSLDGDPNQQITLGTFYPLDPIGDPYNNMSVPMDYGDAVTKSLELLNLSAPIINGSMTVTPPAISMQNPWNPDVEYAITLDQGADKRRRYSAYSSYHWLDVSMLMLLAPDRKSVV